MLECLGGVYYSGNRHYKAFLLNSCGKEIKECKEIYIMGSGQESFMAYNLLKDRVKVLGMIDNNDKLAGKPAVCGGVYRSIKEVYGDDVCIVIATRRKYLINSTTFWEPVFDYISRFKFMSCLEIGPGRGLLSYMI